MGKEDHIRQVEPGWKNARGIKLSKRITRIWDCKVERRIWTVDKLVAKRSNETKRRFWKFKRRQVANGKEDSVYRKCPLTTDWTNQGKRWRNKDSLKKSYARKTSFGGKNFRITSRHQDRKYEKRISDYIARRD